MVDDIVDGSQYQKSEEHKLAISKNAAMIRDFIREVAAENVVLELCDERYEDEFYEIISHPNYDKTFNQVHKLLNQKRPKRLLRMEEQIAVNEGNFELLVGLDQCSYRMPCKTILGDRNLSITQKRFQAKANLLKLYKEQMQEEKAETKQNSKIDEQKNKSIFDIDEGTQKPVGLFTNPKESKSQIQAEAEIAKLKAVFKDINDGKQGMNSLNSDTVGKEMTEVAKREAQKTEYDIYDEVFIDEINQELLKNISKCEGQLVVVLVRQERLKKFADLWKQANLDFYNS